MVWELILDGPMDGIRNMAIDAALLDDVANSTTTRTVVRFYAWLSPTISLGRNQQTDKAVDSDYCAVNGIEIVHRPTGGRAVLHDDELTYAVISNDTNSFGDTIYGNYKRVSEALCLGYNRLGVKAVLAPETRKGSLTEEDGDPPCFVLAYRHEIKMRR